MLSAGDWKYTKDFSAELFDDNQQSIGTGTLYLKDAKVGDAAQFVTYLEGVYRTGIFSFDFGENGIFVKSGDFLRIWGWRWIWVVGFYVCYRE